MTAEAYLLSSGIFLLITTALNLRAFYANKRKGQELALKEVILKIKSTRIITDRHSYERDR